MFNYGEDFDFNTDISKLMSSYVNDVKCKGAIRSVEIPNMEYIRLNEHEEPSEGMYVRLLEEPESKVNGQYLNMSTFSTRYGYDKKLV